MIWLVGASGLLGAELKASLVSIGADFIATGREVNILDPSSLEKFVGRKKIDWIVNCAGYTDVEKAEDETDLCFCLNAEGPANLAKLANGIDAKMLHISSDYVFDGNKKLPYREDDPVTPIGAYGLSKAEGETAVRAEQLESIILRTAWLYGKYGYNFVYSMLNLLSKEGKVGVVADQYGSPTYTADVVEAIIAIINAPKAVFGVFHCTDGGETTWHGFATEIQSLGLAYGILATTRPIAAVSTDEYRSKAKRPAYSVLSSEKIRREYGLTMPTWKRSLERFIADIAAHRDSPEILHFLPQLSVM